MDDVPRTADYTPVICAGFTGRVQHVQQTPEQPITVAVERRVDAHRQAEALAWVQTGTSLASRMPGYLGSGWVRADASSSLWYTLYRFADAASLAAWESSAERRWWLRTGEEFVHDARTERRTGIEGWFDVPTSALVDAGEDEAARPVAPARWKQAVTIWLGFFPTNLVFTLLVSLLPVWGTVPIALRVLITTVVLTPVMTYVVLPFVTARLRPWLEPRAR
ncbi:hypothetical protein SAMN04488544_2345 [Microlunatus sagamiharensis]|uniref:ABM domain-containing protein n=1 Tax=Microlunatus sagamiharensis TaxID=546874 RepID=A0A1H2MPB3_9ACTN|nr:hypothetical protein SAMN04488544_2345 [Microlunatus sagamiharensis]